MVYSRAWKSGAALLLTFGVATGTVAPMLMNPAPAVAQSAFPDVPSSYWANGFINALVSAGVISGFPDGTFRPEEPVTRAQYASMIAKAFGGRTAVRSPINFVDVPSGYWASNQIQRAYALGFMTGYPGNQFRPDENIPRTQIPVSLTDGLGYTATANAETILASAYSDAAAIPAYARPGVAAATQRQMIVNYPDVKFFNPNRAATRAEVAALIYQALVSTGQVAAINSPYIVGAQAPQPSAIRIPAGTAIPIRYEGAEKILLSQDEPSPIPLVLKVAQNVVTSSGRVLIPAGSDVIGQLQVVQGGTGAQFVASEIVLPSNDRLAVNATSEVITRTETVTQGVSVGKLLAGAAVGSGAAAGIAAVTGDKKIQAWEVLTGTAAGTLLGAVVGRDKVTLISVEPNSDLSLTLNSDLTIPVSASGQ
ncbi:S-layer homology domain-containing protein [Pantanalinema sp. GBBB05]|uniref:S-layer homology domain-containing protein n=1 Tax=Pantanalinema sp. GBBB05 TaxID=2604139 RepID=UPI001D893AEF|nr:S-layer homology domain-containing protein [Pantanalinema sp. GBBB05]